MNVVVVVVAVVDVFAVGAVVVVIFGSEVLLINCTFLGPKLEAERDSTNREGR